MELYHYYDRTIGPFRNLSDLPLEEAKAVLDRIRKENPDPRVPGEMRCMWSVAGSARRYCGRNLPKREEGWNG